MKTLNGHTILYDASCPMCRLYTGAFVKSGMLDAEGRAPYQGLQEGSCPLLDRQRAVNEIALLDRASGHVTYGVESLFKILGHRWPWMRRLFTFRPFSWTMKKAYSLVSYNRRVIMPAAEDSAGAAPAFHAGWRIAWIIMAWLLTACLLQHYNQRSAGLLPVGGALREYAACGGQLIWQGALVLALGHRKVADYLGTMMTLSLAGGLVLALGGLVLDLFGITSPWVAGALFGVVVLLMLLEHLRRCRLLGLPWMVSSSWILYRIILLYIIMN